MTNREKILKTNTYDLLCRIQRSLSESGGKISGLCIIEDLEGKARPCPDENSFGKGCELCIADWLSEEASP